MRHYKLLFTLFILLCCGSLFASQPFTNEKGQSVNLTDHPGKFLLINYWASWCPACKEEIPALNKFYQQHAKTVILYGVDYDAPPLAELPKVMQDMHIEYPNLNMDPHDELHLPDVPALPVTFVFDERNHLIATLYGPQTVQSLAKSIKAKV